MQGIIAISGSSSGGGTDNAAGVTLDNGSYIVTPSNAVYVAPWYAVSADSGGQNGAIHMAREQFYIAGSAWNFSARIVFECDSDTITGTVWRSSADTEVQVILPPQHFEFAPGQTEIPFSIQFWPVNDARVQLETPEWARALLRR